MAQAQHPAKSGQAKPIKSHGLQTRETQSGKIHDPANVRTLELYEVHTKAYLPKTIYWQNGNYIQDGIDKLNNFMSNRRTHKMQALDLTVYDQLHQIKEYFGKPGPINIISGYRDHISQQEIFAAAKKSHKGQPVQVATPGNSQHEFANAIDFSLRGVSAKKVYEVASSLLPGGVGFYPKGEFVHIDTDKAQPKGHPRRWIEKPSP